MLRPAVVASALLLAAVTPVRAQCPDGSAPPCGRVAAAPASNSVAVLYFEARDTADTFLAEGLSEEIATSLGHIPRLVIKIPSAVRRVQNANAGDVRAIGRSLGVKWVVDGSVRRSGTQLRVSVRLVDAERETATWSNAFTRAQADLLSIQEDIAREVATGVVGALTPAERATVSARPTENAQAYEHYLKGNWYLGRRGNWLARAVEEYEAAVRIDRSFDAPRAGISLAWTSAVDYGQDFVPALRDLAPGAIRMRALALADSVVQRNPSLALGWIARGAASRAMGQMDDARRALDRAVTLEPNSVEAHYRLGQLHVVTGEYEEAQRRLTRVLTLDPGHAVTYYYLGVTAYFERRMTDARRTLDSALTLDPTFLGALHWRMVVLIAARDSAEARRSMETYFQLNEVARRRLDTARTFGDSVVATGGMVAHTMAQRLALVGQHEEALRLIATRRVRGDSLPDPQINNPYVCRHVVADPAFDPVRRDPRFVEYERACLAARPD